MPLVRKYIIIALVLFGVSACEDQLGSGRLNEGTILFNIEYLDDEKQNPIISLLPNTMVLKFKDNNTVHKIEGFFGVFSMTYILDNQKGVNHTLVKIVDKKFLYEAQNTEPTLGYNPIHNLQIEYLDQQKEIAGFQCMKAIANYEDEDGVSQSIELYYTDKLLVDNPNSFNPFSQINGVLLEYQVKLNNINMKFTASEIKDIDVSDDDFVIPPGFMKVSRDKMEETMDTYMPKK